MSLPWLLALPFIGSVLAAFLPRNARNAESWLAGGVALTGFVGLLLLFPQVSDQGVLRFELAWVSSHGLDLVLRLDGFAWLFASMVYGIGVLVILYARYYMSPEDPVPRFFAFLLAFMGAMIGIVLAGNLIQLIFFWELTSLFSFLLIGYWHHDKSARDGARMALVVTATGGLCLLGGAILIGHIVGSYDLDVILASGDLIRNHALYLPALVMVLLGALTKSAQFPFHFWLPRAMAAPTPVSAYLHSATMVKAGVFLLARLWPVLSGTDAWFWLVGSAGLATLLLGAFIAMFQHDLKGLLAYSTISHLGLITLLLGMNSPMAAVAAVFHIINHATFKASLFMAAGVIDHETGTRDMRVLSGLGRALPYTAALAMVASAAMAGVPLVNGFLSKEMFFAETLTVHAGSALHQLLPYLATLAGMFGVVYSVRFIMGTFFGPLATDLPRTPHEPPRWMRLPIELLVVACVVVGVVPALTIGPYLEVAVRSILGSATPEYSLAVWHGWNVPLLMSMVALAGGIGLYLTLRRQLERGALTVPIPAAIDGGRLFDGFLTGLTFHGAPRVERVFGTQRLQPQLAFVVISAVVAAALPLWGSGLALGRPTLAGADFTFVTFWIVGCGCALGAAWFARYHRLTALVMMGATGLVVSLTFVWLSAPDLGITQALVEIVTTVLLLLGLRWLPKRVDPVPTLRERMAQQGRTVRDLTLAVASGLGMAVVSWAVMTRPLPDSVSREFVARAYPEGGGTNVVNVILVDFRGFDTLGEITVLGVVAITIYALLRRFRPAPDSVGTPVQQRIQAYGKGRANSEDFDPVENFLFAPALLMHWFFPIIAVLGTYLFLRGHDLPGGGFAAGIAISIGFVVQYMAGGARWVEDRLRIMRLRWIAVGILIALGTGAASWLVGDPFLTSYFRYLELPLIGPVPMASALLFDLGVLLLVVGTTTLILTALAHQSIRGQRQLELAEQAAIEEAARLGPPLVARGNDPSPREEG